MARVLIFALLIAASAGQCPEKNGRFPVSGQCDKYIECVDGEASEKLCPDGLLFNDQAKFYTYPCQYPTDVDCTGRERTQPPQPTEDCPHQFGYFRLGDAANCGSFMNCASGRGYTFQCPDGLAFDSSVYKCNWPDQVADCDAEAFLGFRCPEERIGPLGPQGFFRTFRAPDGDCGRYYICMANRPRMFRCGEGQAFDEATGGCVDAENVPGCFDRAATSNRLK